MCEEFFFVAGKKSRDSTFNLELEQMSTSNC
jgi:hypothetical protein